jgi:hypothetical protein
MFGDGGQRTTTFDDGGGQSGCGSAEFRSSRDGRSTEDVKLGFNLSRTLLSGAKHTAKRFWKLRLSRRFSFNFR